MLTELVCTFQHTPAQCRQSPTKLEYWVGNKPQLFNRGGPANEEDLRGYFFFPLLSVLQSINRPRSHTNRHGMACGPKRPCYIRFWVPSMHCPRRPVTWWVTTNQRSSSVLDATISAIDPAANAGTNHLTMVTDHQQCLYFRSTNHSTETITITRQKTQLLSQIYTCTVL